MSDDIWRIRLTGQDKRLSISKQRVRSPYPSPGSRRLMEGHQIVALRIRVRFSSITPHGQVCIVAIAADCKSVTLIHRRFDSYLAHQYGGFV